MSSSKIKNQKYVQSFVLKACHYNMSKILPPKLGNESISTFQAQQT